MDGRELFVTAFWEQPEILWSEALLKIPTMYDHIMQLFTVIIVWMIYFFFFTKLKKKNSGVIGVV